MTVAAKAARRIVARPLADPNVRLNRWLKRNLFRQDFNICDCGGGTRSSAFAARLPGLSVQGLVYSRNPRARCDPVVVGLEGQAKLVVEDPQIAVPTADNRLRHDRLHFLRYDADIGFVAAIVAEAIEPEPVVEATEESDVVLEPDIGPPTTTATTRSAPAPTAKPRTASASEPRTAPGRTRARHGI